MTELSWAATVRIVHERAKDCCEYCYTCQRVIGQAMHVEHIIPDGGDHLDNLCLSCASCNLSKAKAIVAPDPEMDEIVPLFNPRQQNWREHFVWAENGKYIWGKTAIGRATVQRLKMNNERVTSARALWIRFGVHPPNLDK